MIRARIHLIAFATVCLLLAGCSTDEPRYVLNAPWGYMRVESSFSKIGAAVAYVATTEGVKEINEKSQGSDMMQRSRYIYMTPDGVTIEVVSFLEQGEAMRVFVSIDPEDEVKLSAITSAIWDRLPKD